MLSGEAAVGVIYSGELLYLQEEAESLNLDFTLGVGVFHGKCKEYLPIDGRYVWQLTKKMNWVGPTKAEISLVWHIGDRN